MQPPSVIQPLMETSYSKLYKDAAEADVEKRTPEAEADAEKRTAAAPVYRG